MTQVRPFSILQEPLRAGTTPEGRNDGYKAKNYEALYDAALHPALRIPAAKFVQANAQHAGDYF